MTNITILRPGEHFMFKNFEWVCLDPNHPDGGLLAIMAEPWARDVKFCPSDKFTDERGNWNNYRTSNVRGILSDMANAVFEKKSLLSHGEQGKVVLDEAGEQTVYYETGWYEPEILGSGGSYRGVAKTSSEEEALQQLQKHTVNYAHRITVYKKDGKTVKREVAEYDQWEKKWRTT